MNYTKILVVDDDSNIRDLLKQSLENEGYEVRTAADGYEAIDTFKKYEPDIMLLDIMLPGKSGRDVCTEIRKFSSKPIIMITAKGDVVDKVVCLELGADDFIVKPFDMNELFGVIRIPVYRRIILRIVTQQDFHGAGLMEFFPFKPGVGAGI